MIKDFLSEVDQGSSRIPLKLIADHWRMVGDVSLGDSSGAGKKRKQFSGKQI